MPRTRSDAGPSRIPATHRAPRRQRLGAAAFVLSSATLAFFGCASVLDIDDQYVLESQSSSGGSGSAGEATGGKSAAGGASSGGRTSASGGTAGAGGIAASGGGSSDLPDAACVPGSCGAGTKCCNGQCVEPKPIVGCSLTACERCPEPPPHGTAECVGSACGVKCNDHFVLNTDGLCEPEQSNTGGAGGVSGAGGTPSTGGAAAPVKCDPKACPGCGAPGPFGCCKNDDQCGCSWTPSGGAYCL